MSFQLYLDSYRTSLLKNLSTCPSFDPNAPYEEKNAYFESISVATARHLFTYAGLVPFAEQFYRTMIDTILNFEQRSGKNFNKGMVYANLGIALIAHANLDEGIYYLLLADKEDSSFIHEPHGILNSGLWRQFEDQHVIAHLLQLNTNTHANLHFHIDEVFIFNFMTSLTLSDRLFLEATIWTTYRNIEFDRINSNDYTRGRLYSSLKDLCLLTETLLRRRQRLLGVINPNANITLGPLLSNALSGIGIGYPDNTLPTGAASLQDFLDNLEQILSRPVSSEIKRIYCLHLVRNFTGHHFDVSSNIRTATGNDFFDLYEAALVNIISAILYLAQGSLI